MNVLKLIANGNFITVNKVVARAVGLTEAVVLGALCSEFVYCESKGRLTDDGFFPFSVNALQEETTIGEKGQKIAITNLIKAGLLEQKNIGQPQTRHFKLNDDTLMDLLEIRPSDGFKSVQKSELNPSKQTNYISKKDSKKVCNKVEEEVKEEVEPFGFWDSIDRIYESAKAVAKECAEQREDEMIAEIIKSWNAQKNIRTTIDRILPLSKRYNDTFLTISQFGYDTFIYQILSLDNNQFFEEWKPSYDWFCQPNNFNKVFDGNYRFGKAKEVDKYSKEYWDSL